MYQYPSQSIRSIGKKKFSCIKYTRSDIAPILMRLDSIIMDEKYVSLYPGGSKAEMKFRSPYPLCEEVLLICLAVIRLLLRYIYHMDYTFARFTIVYTIIIPRGEVHFTLGNSIVLKESGCSVLPMKYLYQSLYSLIRKKAEDYEGMELKGIAIKVFYKGENITEKVLPLSVEEVNSKIYSLMIDEVLAGVEKSPGGILEEKSARGPTSNRSYIPPLKGQTKDMRTFIVADIETVLVENEHVPYAAGFLVVNPGFHIGAKSDEDIERYFSEDHMFLQDFTERSSRMLYHFLERLAVVCTKKKIHTIFFHNLGQFDGILLLKYLTSPACEGKYIFKPLMRNNYLYELRVYKGKKLLYRLRDSLLLLPRSLDDLARTLCPELGVKGSFNHKKIRISNLMKNREKIMSYLAQDIRLLGGVMLKAQVL